MSLFVASLLAVFFIWLLVFLIIFREINDLDERLTVIEVQIDRLMNK